MASLPTSTTNKSSKRWLMSTSPLLGVGGSYHLAESYPPVHYIATDNYALVESAFLHLKEKGVNRFAFLWSSGIKRQTLGH